MDPYFRNAFSLLTFVTIVNIASSLLFERSILLFLEESETKLSVTSFIILDEVYLFFFEPSKHNLYFLFSLLLENEKFLKLPWNPAWAYFILFRTSPRSTNRVLLTWMFKVLSLVWYSYYIQNLLFSNYFKSVPLLFSCQVFYHKHQGNRCSWRPLFLLENPWVSMFIVQQVFILMDLRFLFYLFLFLLKLNYTDASYWLSFFKMFYRRGERQIESRA